MIFFCIYWFSLFILTLMWHDQIIITYIYVQFLIVWLYLVICTYVSSVTLRVLRGHFFMAINNLQCLYVPSTSVHPQRDTPSCFHNLTIMIKLLPNICLQDFIWTCFKSFEYILWDVIANLEEHECIVLLYYVFKLPSKLAALSSAMNGSSQMLCISLPCDLGGAQIFATLVNV